MSDTVLDRLTALLDAHGASYRVMHHAPVFTSAEAAAVRGTSLASGAKALVCKADDQFVLMVLPADCKLDSKGLRKTEKIRSLRFASREDLLELTGLEPGSIPPFGQLFNLPTWCDEGLAAQEEINFNAGDHSVSIAISFAEYRRVEEPRMCAIAESSL